MLTESYFYMQVRCSDGFESYGRRRREANASSVLEEIVSVDTEKSDQLVTVLPSEVETSVTAVLDETTSPETIGDTTSSDPTAATAEVTLIPPTDEAENFTTTTTTTTSTTTTEAAKTPEPRRKVNQYIPVEVPLHLQLIVAPEADRIAILPPPNREYERQEMANRRRPSWRSPSFTEQYQDRIIEESTECSPKSTLVAVSVVAALLQAATLIFFYFFYRTKRSSWTKWSDKTSSTDPVYGIRHSGSVSEVVSLLFPYQFCTIKTYSFIQTYLLFRLSVASTGRKPGRER